MANGSPRPFANFSIFRSAGVMPVVRIATRGSALALWQANFVAGELQRTTSGRANAVQTEIVVVSTSGDRDKTSPLHTIGGKGIFCKEVQAAVLDGRADIAVHSAKDLPALTPDGLTIAAVPERGDPRDVLVGARLGDLSPGARIGTGSVRRRAQLFAIRPDLVFAELRGNIATRLAKADDFDAIVMAAAALVRLDEQPPTVDVVPVETMIPQVGQGTLAVECRTDDDELRAHLAGIDHVDTNRRLVAERAFLRELGGDCSLPAGAFAEHDQSGGLTLRAFLASEDLSRSATVQMAGHDDDALGVAAARSVRDRLAGTS